MEYKYSKEFHPPAPVVGLIISAPVSKNSISSLALVDSGADVTVVPESVVTHLKLRRVDSVLASGFGGKFTEVTVYAAILGIEGILEPQFFRVLVWDSEYALLGRDLLNKLVAVLHGPKTMLDLKLPATSSIE